MDIKELANSVDDKQIVSFEYDKELAHELKVVAAKLNISRSELIRRAVERYVEYVRQQ